MPNPRSNNGCSKGGFLEGDTRDNQVPSDCKQFGTVYGNIVLCISSRKVQYGYVVIKLILAFIFGIGKTILNNLFMNNRSVIVRSKFKYITCKETMKWLMSLLRLRLQGTGQELFRTEPDRISFCLHGTVWNRSGPVPCKHLVRITILESAVSTSCSCAKYT